MSNIKINKEAMKHSNDRYLTQSLFLEFGYNTEYAQFTLDDDHKEYNGKTYYSLKKLYLELGDLGEYDFANKYLLGWNHWMRLYNNKQIREHIDQWRDELEHSLRSEALRSLIEQATVKGSYQAAKFLLDRGWDKRAVGRPSQEEIDRRLEKDARLKLDFESDISILRDYRKAN